MDVIYKQFQKQALSTPQAIAVRHHQTCITYAEIHEKILCVAHALQSKGIQPDDLVGICLPRTISQIISIFGVLAAGSAYVPFDVLHQDARIKHLLHINHIQWLITDQKAQHRFQDIDTNIICIEKLLSQKTPHQSIKSTTKPHNLAYMIHTSGSTGTPKGVLIEQQSVMHYCRWFQTYTQLKPGCRIDYANHYVFDMAVTTSLLPLLFGYTIILCDDEIKQDPMRYFEHIHTHRIQCIKLTPSYFKALLKSLRTRTVKLPQDLTLILGGENLSTSDCIAWLHHYPTHRIFNEYGPTETTVGVMQHLVTHENVSAYQPNIPIGTPAPGVTYFLLDDQQQWVKPGETGELYLGGACLARGYHQQPQITAEKFVTYPNISSEKLYRTGDLCRLNQQGLLEYLGRMDRQIKIRGYRVELGEIEHELRLHPSIQDALVIVSNEQHLCAYYLLAPGQTEPKYSEICRHLLRRLPHYMIPKYLIALKQFPLTSNGKLDEKALPLPSPQKTALNKRNISKTEQQLIEIWQEEFELPHIDVHDNFYALGGHSLHATRIVSAIHQIIGKKISLAEFYQAESIAALYALLSRRRRVRVPATIQAPSTIHSKRYPLSDFQLLLWLCKTFEPKACQLNLVSRKRIQGPICFETLQHTFETLIARHPLLQQRIAKTYPAYVSRKRHDITIAQTDVSHLDMDESESLLQQSLKTLAQIYPWPKHQPLVMLKVFYLKNQWIELQLCMPHLISDETSMHLFWKEMSQFYELITEKKANQTIKTLDVSPPRKSFHDYVIQEQSRIATHFENDCEFWQQQFQNSQLFVFAEDIIIRHMTSRKLPYSSYHHIPQTLLQSIQEFCIQHHLSLEDLLCAAVDQALREITAHQPCVSVINMVKSTRQNNIYDETIGCFLRVDPIKIETEHPTSLLDRAKKIRENGLAQASFFEASTILKLAFLAAKNHRRKQTYILKFIIDIYCLILDKFRLQYKALQLSAYFSSFKRDNQFIIYMNLWQNFISPQHEMSYLGRPYQAPPFVFHDISSWDNLCDISFVRDEQHNQPYVVVSSNLVPEAKQHIAQSICHLLEELVNA